ncbi:MAG: HIT family protein [Burkholderiales bacterium]
MPYDPQNVFAKILRRELPCIKLYEDEQTLAFMDLMPQTEGHALIIPKEEAAMIFELSPASLAATMLVTQKIAKAVRKAFDVPGVLIVQANGEAAMQSVPHLHFHVIPRRNCEIMRLHAAVQEDQEKLEQSAAQIIAALE